MLKFSLMDFTFIIDKSFHITHCPVVVYRRQKHFLTSADLQQAPGISQERKIIPCNLSKLSIRDWHVLRHLIMRLCSWPPDSDLIANVLCFSTQNLKWRRSQRQFPTPVNLPLLFRGLNRYDFFLQFLEAIK